MIQLFFLIHTKASKTLVEKSCQAGIRTQVLNSKCGKFRHHSGNILQKIIIWSIKWKMEDRYLPLLEKNFLVRCRCHEWIRLWLRQLLPLLLLLLLLLVTSPTSEPKLWAKYLQLLILQELLRRVRTFCHDMAGPLLSIPKKIEPTEHFFV